MNSAVLIIDDEEKLRSLLARIIGLEGFEVFQAGGCEAAWKQLEKHSIDVVLCDVKLPDGNGVELSKQIKNKYPSLEIVLLTAYGNIPDSVQAIKNGAFDYITKGDDNNRIIPLLYKAVEKVELNRRLHQLEKQLEKKYAFSTLIRKSKSIQKVIALVEKVALTDSTILLTGETGTGKEVFAQAIHNEGARANKSFVAINCSAFSRDLLEGELFGHKAGSFTSATRDQKGLLEEAHNGTLFLDEIGEMPLDLQAKILRVIETGEFLKIGDTKPIKINVRIIAATNKNLKNEIAAGHFREDLFYRLSVIQIAIPALRERGEDIIPLAQYFVTFFANKLNKSKISISPNALRTLTLYQWPGNVRELKNVIERSAILCNDDVIDVADLPIEIQNSDIPSKTLSAFSVAAAEKLHIQKVLNLTKGNKAEAARLLEIGIATLYRKIEEYGL
jgi:two-component system, NtrC family, response regulator